MFQLKLKFSIFFSHRFYSVTPTASLLHEEQLAAVLAGLRALCL